MKICSKCGEELFDEAVVCPKCGCAISSFRNTESEDAPDTGYTVIGFLIPLIGLILYLTNKDKYPLKAESAKKGALIGFCIGIAFSILAGIVYAVTLGSLFSSLMSF